MDKFLFIKYYYTTNEIEQMFEEMQVTVEDKLEELFGDVNCFLQFIDVSQSAYLCDIIEVEHNFPLSKENKQTIFDVCKENIYFIDNLDESEDRELFVDLYEKNFNLMYAKFIKINDDDIIISQDMKSQ